MEIELEDEHVLHPKDSNTARLQEIWYSTDENVRAEFFRARKERNIRAREGPAPIIRDFQVGISDAAVAEMTRQAMMNGAQSAEENVMEWILKDDIISRIESALKKEKGITREVVDDFLLNLKTRIQIVKTKLEGIQDLAVSEPFRIKLQEFYDIQGFLKGERFASLRPWWSDSYEDKYTPKRLREEETSREGEIDITAELLEGQKEITPLEGINSAIIRNGKVVFKEWTYLKMAAPFMALALVLLTIEAVYLHGVVADGNTFKLRHNILTSYISSPEEILRESCQTIADSVRKSEGVMQDQITIKTWDKTIASLEPLYIQAYERASEEMIKIIAILPVTNWGTPALLPEISYSLSSWNPNVLKHVQDQHDQKMNQWKVLEHLRPIQLQYTLLEGFVKLVHRSAFDLLVDDPLFSNDDNDEDVLSDSTIGLSRRVEMPSECRGYIREERHITAQYKKARSGRDAWYSRVKVASESYFAERSALPPTLPLPAVHATG